MRIIFALTLVFSIYGVINFYITRRIYQGLTYLFPNLNIIIYSIVIIFVSLSVILGYIPIHPIINNFLRWVGSYWMGIFVYFFLFFLAADIILFSGSLLKIIPFPLTQNIRFFTGLIVILLTTCLIFYGKYNANIIKNVTYDVRIKESVLSDEIKIVMIADLHLGTLNSEKNLTKIIQRINALEGDIVCIVGDIFNDDFNVIKNPQKASDLFKSINSKYGVYACLGNHDGGKTFNEMVSFLKESNIKLLNDEYEIIDDQFILIGRLDPSPIGGFGGLVRKDISEILISIDKTLPIIVMDHTPSNIEQYGEEIDLILSGHTHRGQIFPGSLITRAMFTVDYGYYQKDVSSPHVIVTSGVNTWGTSLRIGTNNEIVSIRLQ